VNSISDHKNTLQSDYPVTGWPLINSRRYSEVEFKDKFVTLPKLDSQIKKN